VSDPAVGVVVLDVRLPDLDGIQVLASIREKRPELSVIMLSASTDQEIVLEALRLGASDYLAKPLHDEELVLAVGRALDAYEVNADRRRLRARVDRLVEGMERLSQLVRLADPAERVSVLRQGIVDSAGVVLRASRVSLMLADADREWLSVVATRGSGVDRETLAPRKVGEGASGLAFAEGAVLCVPDVQEDDRFAGRAMGEYASSSFAIVPLVCLGVPVGVLCLTEATQGEDFEVDGANMLRLLGMQISEFLAADPDVERLLQQANAVDVEGVEALVDEVVDGDAELARAVCDAIASEVEPERVLRGALSAVASQLEAAPVSLFLLSRDGSRLESEVSVDGGRRGDRESLPTDRGLSGHVWGSGQIVATPDPAAEARFVSAVDTPEDDLSRPFVCVPLKLRNKPVGLLRLFFESDRIPSPRTAEVLAACFSAAVRTVLLYRSLAQSIEEIAEARRRVRS
jgi:CheY-like chemotaxis protein